MPNMTIGEAERQANEIWRRACDIREQFERAMRNREYKLAAVLAECLSEALRAFDRADRTVSQLEGAYLGETPEN